MPSFDFEQSIGGIVIGVDEVGCGPWAGPLIAASCYIDPSIFPASLLALLEDSKKLTPKKREHIFNLLKMEENNSIFFGVGCVDIDDFNILGLKHALPKAMRLSVEHLSKTPDHILIDGVRDPKLGYPTTMIKKGDSLSYSIAAASIYAKVIRDHIMQDLHTEFPQYGWDKNAGYGTKVHRDAIAQYGITPHHRTCYAPIQAFLCTS